MLAPSVNKITILNLVGKKDRQDIYSPTSITGWRAKEVDTTSQVSQILASTAYSYIYLFDKYVAWGKPPVEARAYKKMTKAQKCAHATLETSDTYLVFGELEDREYTLNELKEDYRVFKVSQIERKTMGSIAVRHLRVSIK